MPIKMPIKLNLFISKTENKNSPKAINKLKKFDNIIDRGVLFDDIEEAEIVSFEKKTVLKNFVLYANQQDYNKHQMKYGMELLKQINF
jgi:hypothetical protein